MNLSCFLLWFLVGGAGWGGEGCLCGGGGGGGGGGDKKIIPSSFFLHA